jgi:hypothetical protein
MGSPIPRIPVPPAGQTAEGWCLYKDDQWNGPAPQDWDDDGWIVYPDPTAAWAGLAREMRRRCDLFDAGKWPGTQLVTNWYPVPVTYLPDGAVRDETGAEFEPGQPW